MQLHFVPVKLTVGSNIMTIIGANGHIFMCKSIIPDRWALDTMLSIFSDDFCSLPHFHIRCARRNSIDRKYFIWFTLEIFLTLWSVTDVISSNWNVLFRRSTRVLFSSLFIKLHKSDRLQLHNSIKCFFAGFFRFRQNELHLWSYHYSLNWHMALCHFWSHGIRRKTG